MNKSLIEYYHERAGEYERVYRKPERQADLLILRRMVMDTCYSFFQKDSVNVEWIELEYFWVLKCVKKEKG